MDPYAMDFGGLTDYKLRTAYAGITRTKILRRPSWLHPFKRVLWVHRHGRVAEVRVSLPDHRHFAKISNLTA